MMHHWIQLFFLFKIKDEKYNHTLVKNITSLYFYLNKAIVIAIAEIGGLKDSKIILKQSTKDKKLISVIDETLKNIEK